jgi:hypothetical protein
MQLTRIDNWPQAEPLVLLSYRLGLSYGLGPYIDQNESEWRATRSGGGALWSTSRGLCHTYLTNAGHVDWSVWAVRFSGNCLERFQGTPATPSLSFRDVSVSDSPMIAAFGMLPAIWLSLFVRRLWVGRRRSPAGRCATCAYNLTANTSGVCPECGTPTSASLPA